MLRLSLRPQRINVQLINGVQFTIHPLVPDLEVPDLPLLHTMRSSSLGIAAVEVLHIFFDLASMAYRLGHDGGLVPELLHFEWLGYGG